MAITSVTKERDSLVIVEDGVTKRRSIVYRDCVVSYPPTGYTQVGVIYVDEPNSKLIIQYNGSTTEIELDATIDLTGAEIVALLEALGVGSRLEITYLDDGSTYIRFTVTEQTKLGNIETAATADQTGAEIVALLEALTAGNRLSHTKLDDLTTGDPHTQYILVNGERAFTIGIDIVESAGLLAVPSSGVLRVYAETVSGLLSLCLRRVGSTSSSDDPDNDEIIATLDDIDTHEAAADPHTGYQKESEKGAASGYASLSAATKVVEQPVSITDHLEGTPTEDLTTKAPTSEWAFDHNADVDAHHNEIHGIAKHTDVTRTLFVPCGVSHTGGAYWRNAITLDKDADEYVDFSFFTPSDFVSFSSLKVIWYGESIGGAGNDWRCNPTCTYGTENEAYNAHTDNPADLTIDVAVVNRVYFTAVGFTMASLVKGDCASVRIERDANHADDDFDDEIDIIGLLLTYTAEQ